MLRVCGMLRFSVFHLVDSRTLCIICTETSEGTTAHSAFDSSVGKFVICLSHWMTLPF